jgi:hypothetical protein
LSFFIWKVYQGYVPRKLLKLGTYSIFNAWKKNYRKNKPKSTTSTPSSSKTTSPIKASKVSKQPPTPAKAKGVRPGRQDQYENDGFIVDDDGGII